MDNLNKLVDAIRSGKMQSFSVEDTSMRPVSNGSSLVNRVAEAVSNAANNADKIRSVQDNVKSVLGGSSSFVDKVVKAADDAAAEVLKNQDVDEEDTVTYTYKPGDTFGQVLLNLGISKPENLWGEGGDVAYYTDQLHNQGIYGNIPVGSTITLKKRK